MRGTTVVTITPTSTTYANPIAARFFDSLELTTAEYKRNGKFSFEIIESILGPVPKIPYHSDMDTMLEAYEEVSAYSDKVLDIESKLKSYASKK